jgi:hypothetical protein
MNMRPYVILFGGIFVAYVFFRLIEGKTIF